MNLLLSEWTAYNQIQHEIKPWYIAHLSSNQIPIWLEKYSYLNVIDDLKSKSNYSPIIYLFIIFSGWAKQQIRKPNCVTLISHHSKRSRIRPHILFSALPLEERSPNVCNMYLSSKKWIMTCIVIVSINSLRNSAVLHHKKYPCKNYSKFLPYEILHITWSTFNYHVRLIWLAVVIANDGAMGNCYSGGRWSMTTI